MLLSRYSISVYILPNEYRHQIVSADKLILPSGVISDTTEVSIRMLVINLSMFIVEREYIAVFIVEFNAIKRKKKLSMIFIINFSITCSH
jgi:hypothetical protein